MAEGPSLGKAVLERAAIRWNQIAGRSRYLFWRAF
jgi:hypothetical protein